MDRGMNNNLRLYNLKDHLCVFSLLVYSRYLPHFLRRRFVNTQCNVYLAYNPLFKSFNSKRTSLFQTLLNAAKIARCKTLIANFQADRICIATFGRDDQPVNYKRLQYPLKEETLIFQQCPPACKEECRIKRE